MQDIIKEHNFASCKIKQLFKPTTLALRAS